MKHDISPQTAAIGWWLPADARAQVAPSDDSANLIADIRRAVHVVDEEGRIRFHHEGEARIGTGPRPEGARPLLAWLPAIPATRLGDPGFCADYSIRLPYMAGSMANGIASVELVQAMARAGMLASFGAGGLDVARIEAAVIELKQSLGDLPWACNLIHTPNEVGHEDRVVDLLLKHDVRLVEASAYLALTPAAVRYRVSGIHKDDNGRIVTPNRIIAKASRVEVATHWFSPPPAKMLAELLASGAISPQQAELAARIPMATDLIVEADSGGHTDNRPAITLIPTLIALRDRLQAEYRYDRPLRIGAAGGIATPASAAAAFAMGAAFIVTGTVNQACRESGSSDLVREMLAAAEQADVAMAPAVDMFEMGVKLQVLKRGTMFAMRANRLYEIYRSHDALETIPAEVRAQLEQTLFRASLEDIWRQTREFFGQRDPREIERAERDPKHRMALVFRWYLGLSSRWANAGVADRRIDYQVWCGPAMGAFNEWTRGSRLEKPAQREVVNVALNLLYGAALVTRLNQLQQQGISLPPDTISLAPRETTELEGYLR